MNEASETNITYDMAAKAFTKGFEQALNLQLKTFELTDQQWNEIHALADSKYRSTEWNMNRNRKRVLA
ncbi:hypothetical protein ACI2OX_01625 [Bacillus sp. N9]